MKFFKTIMLASVLCSSVFATEAKLVSITLEENKEVIPAKVTGTFANVLNCYHKQTLLAKEFDNKMEFIIYIEDYQKEKFSSNTENEVSYIVFDKADLSLSIS